MSNQQHKTEPFGFFRAEPFGWTDCSETDEGAQPLFDQAAIDVITKQRDELLAALEKANSKLRASTMCHPNAVETLVEEAYQVTDAAIAAAKGGAGIERDCCGTFFRSPHRSTCKNYRGNKGGAA